ncbi:hypothetical protein [Fodinicola feengrottensis]|uniref:hypothetical protein n=1 Tax=Fodinicola feengrottensis TaxID=435914 RepID=UPI0013D031DF|nr:hypothetical protein [Fodinicola feengrottensis]
MQRHLDDLAFGGVVAIDQRREESRPKAGDLPLDRVRCLAVRPALHRSVEHLARFLVGRRDPEKVIPGRVETLVGVDISGQDEQKKHLRGENHRQPATQLPALPLPGEKGENRYSNRQHRKQADKGYVVGLHCF